VGYLDVFNRSRRLGREVKMNWQYVLLRYGLVEWMAGGYIPCTNFAHHPRRGAAGTTIEHVRNVTAVDEALGIRGPGTSTKLVYKYVPQVQVQSTGGGVLHQSTKQNRKQNAEPNACCYSSTWFYRASAAHLC